MKSIHRPFLATLFAVSGFVGCGEGGGQPEETTGGSSQKEEEATLTSPPVSADGSPEPFGGMIQVEYILSSSGEGATASISAEYSVYEPATGTWKEWNPATEGPGGDGMDPLPLNSSKPLTFTWNSFSDTPSKSTQVKLRITPAQGKGFETAPFHVSNESLQQGSTLPGFPQSFNSANGDGEKLDDRAERIAADDKYMYVFGKVREFFATGEANSAWRLERRNLATGKIVPFSGADAAGGALEWDPGSHPDWPTDILVDEKYVYVAGHEELDESAGDLMLRLRRWRIEKFDKDTGERDGDFGTEGVIHTANKGLMRGRVILVQDGPCLYVAGTEPEPENPNDYRWRIEKRYKETGKPVETFGVQGAITRNSGNPPAPGGREYRTDRVQGMIVVGERLIAVGALSNLYSLRNGEQLPWMEVVSTDTGKTLKDWSTAINQPLSEGMVASVASDGQYAYLALSMQTDKVVTVCQGETHYFRQVEVRKLHLDDLWAPDSPKTIVTDEFPLSDGQVSLALHDDSLYLGLARMTEGKMWPDLSWRVQRRTLADLALSWTEDRKMSNLENVADPCRGDYDRPEHLVVRKGVLYVVGGNQSQSGGDPRWRIEAMLR